MDLKSWLYTITATIQRFLRNQGTDMAAALTYYTVLTIFPALLCIVSLMKLSGIGDVLVPKLTGLISQASSDEFLTDTLVGLIESFYSSAGAGLGLAIGILAAAWAASGGTSPCGCSQMPRCPMASRAAASGRAPRASSS